MEAIPETAKVSNEYPIQAQTELNNPVHLGDGFRSDDDGKVNRYFATPKQTIKPNEGSNGNVAMWVIKVEAVQMESSAGINIKSETETI